MSASSGHDQILVPGFGEVAARHRFERLVIGYNGDTDLFEPYFKAQQLPASELRHVKGARFAVFAYGGRRDINTSHVSGIVEQTDNPLRGVGQLWTSDSGAALVQWIANSRAREALYRSAGSEDRANQRAEAVSCLEQAIGRVIGTEVRILFDIDSFVLSLSTDNGMGTILKVLPDGLQSLLSWLGDLLMRLDRIPWATPGPVTDRPFVLLLDEVEVHLHPAWQRRVLPMVERLFPNAQIIASTHSPFVIGSASDAWIHPFRLEGDHAVVDPPVPSARGSSVAAILDQLMGVHEEFDVDSEEKLTRFRALWHQRLKGDEQIQPELESTASELLGTIVETELRELRRRLGQVAAR